jgi:hypothetical protein
MPRSTVVSNAAFGFSYVSSAIPMQHVRNPTQEMPFAAQESTHPTQLSWVQKVHMNFGGDEFWRRTGSHQLSAERSRRLIERIRGSRESKRTTRAI